MISQPASRTGQSPHASVRVEVWQVAVAVPASVIDQARGCLPDDALARAKSFRHESAQERHIVAHAALRRLLAGKLNCGPREIAFQIGPHGKPALAASGSLPLHFNLSHSGEFAVVALSEAAEVGVDIEHVRPIENVMALARRFFTPGEQAELEATSPPDQWGCFFRLWTQKEALLKATGQGIANGLPRFEVTSHGHGGLLAADGKVGAGLEWTVFNWKPHADYVAACAVQVRHAALTENHFRFEPV